MDQYASGAYIAPLNLSRPTVTTNLQAHQLIQQHTLEMTPPLTPYVSHDTAYEQDEEEEFYEEIQAIEFHDYMRAFYPYEPVDEKDSSTVTLPLAVGDIVRIHSIHPNGWADGTLLSTGARGWLPTNYCGEYYPEPMHILLNALTNFWGLIHKGSEGNFYMPPTGDYMRGLVAGVRYLLVSRVLRHSSGYFLVFSAEFQ
jgi:hypothetical protein